MATYDCFGHGMCSCGEDDPLALYVHHDSRELFSLKSLIFGGKLMEYSSAIYNPRTEKYSDIKYWRRFIKQDSVNTFKWERPDESK